MRSRLLFLLVPFVSVHLATATDSFVSSTAIIREINLARENPSLYATYLEEMRSHYAGRYTKEGVSGLEGAIRFLRSVRPLQPLLVSPGMCKGAADHCADQASGRRGHGGSDGSSPARRMSRYGRWGSAWAENISYGKTTARDIVIQLIVDDGLPARKHRKNIFNPNFNYAGAAYGPHAAYGSVCNIDFAGNYIERDAAIIARNY